MSMAVRNQKNIEQVLELIRTMNEAAGYLLTCANNRDHEQLEKMAVELLDIIRQVTPIAASFKEEIPHISALSCCENASSSIHRIIQLTRTRSKKLSGKIEFELIPILQEFYYDFYFFTCIFGNRENEKFHYEHEFSKLTANSYIDNSMEEGNFKYDVSIMVLAFNKLEYTRHCVESILRYTPSRINYELILINNGSTDQTEQYFESLAPTKLISLKQNSLNLVQGMGSRIYEGKYLLSISNDVIVTENYMDNLLACMESDPTIAMVVPTTTNISNMQTIPCSYNTLEEMQSFAKENNVSNSERWEERVRLCNPLAMYRSELVSSSSGAGGFDRYLVHAEFGDDALSLRLRRAGYKLILAKDCFCHHFGSVTLRESQMKENTIEKSRKLFEDRFNVDAWSTGFCYDEEFTHTLRLKPAGQVNVLGINSGFGSNPLRIKSLHKEIGNRDILLYNATDDGRYVQDLKVYSDFEIYNKDDVIHAFDGLDFDFILVESNAEHILREPDSLNKLKSKLASGGLLAIRLDLTANVEIIRMLDDHVEHVVPGTMGKWYCWSQT